jgi:hypothetical protein
VNETVLKETKESVIKSNEALKTEVNNKVFDGEIQAHILSLQ